MNDLKEPMKRENRYLVLKISDIEKYLSNRQQKTLEDFCKDISNDRKQDGKRINKYICIADDWPEYETVWKMVEARVNQLEAVRLYGAEKLYFDLDGKRISKAQHDAFYNARYPKFTDSPTLWAFGEYVASVDTHYIDISPNGFIVGGKIEEAK